MLTARNVYRVVGAFAALAAVCACTTPIPSNLRSSLLLQTPTTATKIPASHRYCGGETKQGTGPGNCEGKATTPGGRVPARERVELRGWIVAGSPNETGPHFTEDDEVALNLVLDWGWQPLASGVHAINTPELVVKALTPHNVVLFGASPSNRSEWGSLLPQSRAFGGPNAAVVHVESQAWRGTSSPPQDWSTPLTNPGPGSVERMYAFNPFMPPGAVVPLQIGDYVRLVGTLWEDAYHPPEDPPFIANLGFVGDPASDRVDEARRNWRDGTFGLGVVYCPPGQKGCVKGRGWTELHPVDYMARLDPPTPHADALEVIALVGEGEVVRSVDLPPKPSPVSRVAYQIIDTAFTLLNAGDLAFDDVRVTATGIEVHVKLNARSGIAPGYPKYMKAFYVTWEQ